MLYCWLHQSLEKTSWLSISHYGIMLLSQISVDRRAPRNNNIRIARTVVIGHNVNNYELYYYFHLFTRTLGLWLRHRQCNNNNVTSTRRWGTEKKTIHHNVKIILTTTSSYGTQQYNILCLILYCVNLYYSTSTIIIP